MINDSRNSDLTALSLVGEAQDDIERVESSGIKTYPLSEAPTVSFWTITKQAQEFIEGLSQTQVYVFIRAFRAALLLCCASYQPRLINGCSLSPGDPQDGPDGTGAIVASDLQMTCASSNTQINSFNRGANQMGHYANAVQQLQQVYTQQFQQYQKLAQMQI